ncbi:hypothetical protein Tco_0990567 [Tanacetum coccineum]|uniref:Uncharacterized protein n=1 Tax=Tanacetum coccineum TaxID=301880 RepID=A0ABQ5EWV0_9ASTR
MFVDLTQDDAKTPTPKHQLPSPSAPNAPSKTPSTKDTSSSSIDYISKSPTSSTSPSTNGYLNSPTSPPPRVPPPPLIQESGSRNITLTLSPITPLDIDKITKADLVGSVYKLLKGTCQSIIELEYNMEECYKALSDQLDWTNPEGDRCPYDLSKP